MLSTLRQIRVYISLHSYSQLLMFPWGYTHALPADNNDLSAIALAAVEAAGKRYGTKFRHGPIAKTICKYSVKGTKRDVHYAHS